MSPSRACRGCRPSRSRETLCNRPVLRAFKGRGHGQDAHLYREGRAAYNDNGESVQWRVAGALAQLNRSQGGMCICAEARNACWEFGQECFGPLTAVLPTTCLSRPRMVSPALVVADPLLHCLNGGAEIASGRRQTASSALKSGLYHKLTDRVKSTAGIPQASPDGPARCPTSGCFSPVASGRQIPLCCCPRDPTTLARLPPPNSSWPSRRTAGRSSPP